MYIYIHTNIYIYVYIWGGEHIYTYIYIHTYLLRIHFAPPTPPFFQKIAKVAFYVTRNFKVPVCAAGVRSSSQALIAMGLGASSVILREPLAGCIEAPHGGQATMPLHHTQLEHPREKPLVCCFFGVFWVNVAEISIQGRVQVLMETATTPSNGEKGCWWAPQVSKWGDDDPLFKNRICFHHFYWHIFPRQDLFRLITYYF